MCETYGVAMAIHMAESPIACMAAIRVKGKYLYISNRGADTITRLEIDGKELRLLENTDCGGKNPRDFLIVDDLVFSTNEFTNDVTVLKLVDRNVVKVEVERGKVCRYIPFLPAPKTRM